MSQRMSQQINLFNAQLLRRADGLTARNLGVGLGTAALLCVLASVALNVMNSQLKQQKNQRADSAQEAQNQLATLTQQISEHKPDARLEQERAALDQRLQGRKEIEAALGQGQLGRAEGFAGHFQAFAQLASQQVWLTGVRINSSGLLEIRGRAHDAGQIPVYIGRLNDVPVFHGRSFATLTMKAVQEAAPTTATVPTTPAAPAASAPGNVAAAIQYVEFDLASADGGTRSGGSP